MPRKILLAVLAAVLLTAAILTWGSLGSAVLVLCLVMMAASLAYQHFLTNRDEDGFQSED